MNPFFAGMLVALPMTLGVGPSLLVYFQATMQRGFYAGLAVLSGIWASDTGFIFVNYLMARKLGSFKIERLVRGESSKHYL